MAPPKAFRQRLAHCLRLSQLSGLKRLKSLRLVLLKVCPLEAILILPWYGFAHGSSGLNP